MNYEAFFSSINGKVKKIGIIGTGHYSTAIVAQCRKIPFLEVSGLADIKLENAINSCKQAGYTEEDYSICESPKEVQRAYDLGKLIVTQDPLLLMIQGIDTIVEATGHPEGGALHALEAIKANQNVLMVTKEVDVSVGPILKHISERKGLCYSAVDGDQHGLLIKLVSWVRTLGLNVICGGKAIEFDLIYDQKKSIIQYDQSELLLNKEEADSFTTRFPEISQISKRKEILGNFGAPAGYDFTEMTIAANATGLKPDKAELNCPILTIPEIPEILSLSGDGGILNSMDTLDCFTCLRTPYEAGMGGGEFVVVDCENEYSRNILITKGLLSNRKQTAALIYQPYHLCGVETPISIILASFFNLPTGAKVFKQAYDIVARTLRDFKKGEKMGSDKSKELQPMILKAQPLAPKNPIPFQLGRDNEFARDIPKGTIITTDMIVPPKGSTLWRLREEQDKMHL